MIDWVQALDRVFPERLTSTAPIMALTDDWYRARRGRCTASRRAQTIAVGRPKGWATMATEIEWELTDKWRREEVNVKALHWGRDFEAQALANAELELGAEVMEPGLVFHPDYSYAAATPDFFVGDEITGQIKCPSTPKHHLKYVYGEALKGTYLYQVQWEAWVSQRKKIVFMSYDPRQPIATRCSVQEIDADMQMWESFDRRLAEFKSKFESSAVKATATFKGFTGIPEIF